MAKVVVEAKVFALASHIFWGVWSILQVLAMLRAFYCPLSCDNRIIDKSCLRKGSLWFAPMINLFTSKATGRDCQLMLRAQSCSQRAHFCDEVKTMYGAMQAKLSQVDFEYAPYADLRWEEYHRCKPAALAALDEAFPNR